MKNQRNAPIFIVLGTICLVAVGWTTWYLVYVRPRLNADPVKVYRSTIPAQKETTQTVEKPVPAASDTTDVGVNQDTSVEAEETSPMPTSESSLVDVETSNSVISPDENRQMNPEQDAQKRTAAAARQAEIARVLAESEKLLKSVEVTLARHDQYMEILDKFPIFPHQGKLSEAEKDMLKSQVLPVFLEGLNSLSVEKQREFAKRVRPMVKSMVGDPGQADKVTDEFFKTLREHGFQFAD